MSTQTHNRQVVAPHETGTIKHSGLLHDLRALVPNHRISHIEALRITEHQASALQGLGKVAVDGVSGGDTPVRV